MRSTPTRSWTTIWWQSATALVLMASILMAPAIFKQSGAHAAPVPVGHPGAGVLSNFDVSNDTGVYCEGFDIQIEDVTVADAPYQYWGTYGQPTVSPMTFPDGHSGIDVRYAATFAGGAYSASTPPGTMDHFGVSVMVPPGNQNLTWLCDSSATAADPGGSGTLVPTGGTATGNGYTNNTITNPVPQITTAIVPTTAGEQVQQQVVNQLPASAAPGVQGNAVWFYRHPSATLTDPLALIDLTPEFPAVAQMTQPQVNDLMNLVDAGGSESASTLAQNGDGAVAWVVDTYAYTDPMTMPTRRCATRLRATPTTAPTSSARCCRRRCCRPTSPTVGTAHPSPWRRPSTAPPRARVAPWSAMTSPPAASTQIRATSTAAAEARRAPQWSMTTPPSAWLRCPHRASCLLDGTSLDRGSQP